MIFCFRSLLQNMFTEWTQNFSKASFASHLIICIFENILLLAEGQIKQKYRTVQFFPLIFRG